MPMNGHMNVNQKLSLTLTCYTQDGKNLIDTGQVLVKLQKYFLSLQWNFTIYIKTILKL